MMRQDLAGKKQKKHILAYCRVGTAAEGVRYRCLSCLHMLVVIEIKSKTENKLAEVWQQVHVKEQ